MATKEKPDLDRRRSRAQPHPRSSSCCHWKVCQVRARGYWEGVWRRFKRDKVALARRRLHHLLFIMLRRRADRRAPPGPRPERPLRRRRAMTEPHPGRADDARADDPIDGHKRRCSSSAPTPRSAATSSCGCSTARGSRSRWRSARPSSACRRRAARRDRRLLRRRDRTRVVSRLTEVIMAFPCCSSSSPWPARSASRLEQHHARRPRPRRHHAGPRPRRSSAGSTRRASSAASCSRCARRSSSRPRA